MKLKVFFMTALAAIVLIAVLRHPRPPAPRCEIRVVFGYKDARPARFVGDRYERAYLIEEVLKRGFARDPDNDDRFTRKGVELRIVHSSVGPDDDLNRRDNEQIRQSEYARRTYLDGLNQAQQVIYVGHSRDGGGPDFSPPRLNRAGFIDFAYYRSQTPGYHATVRQLEKGHDSLKSLAFLSCVSSRHFAKKLESEFPSLAFIGSAELLYYMDSLRAALDLIDRSLRGPCGSSD